MLFHLLREGDRALINGPTLRLQPKAAQVLAMVVHELATNGVEHGPLAQAEGSVEITWRVVSGDREQALLLEWRERGNAGLTSSTRRGFGTAALEDMLAYELNAHATLAYEPEGLRYAAKIPLSPRIGRLIRDDREVSGATPAT